MVSETKAFKVPQPLRDIIMELGGQESKDPGLFFKEHLDSKDQALGVGYIDFRADKNGKPRPKGWCYYSDGGSELKTDDATLNSIPFLATYRRRRDEYLEQMATQLAGEPESKKSIDQVNAECKSKYAESRGHETKEAPEALIPAKSEASQEPAQNTSMVPATQNNVLINHNKTDAIVINEIAVPNEYIVLYKQGQKLVPYIKEKGLEFLAGKMGLWVDPRSRDPSVPVDELKPAIDHEVIKYPWVENEFGPKGVCIVKGIVRLANGQIFTDIGTVTAENSNAMQKKYPLENAITRAKARALRDATHCNVCSLEEADLDPKDGKVIDAEFTIVQKGGEGY